MTERKREGNAAGRVSEALAATIREAIEERCGRYLREIRMEIQDDQNFLLVSLSISSSMPVGDALRILDIAGSEVAGKIPLRRDEYSWMVNILVQGEILKSASGGWLGHPNI